MNNPDEVARGEKPILTEVTHSEFFAIMWGMRLMVTSVLITMIVDVKVMNDILNGDDDKNDNIDDDDATRTLW